MKRYTEISLDHYDDGCGIISFFEDEEGEWVMYEEARKEIETRDWEINILKTEIESKRKLLLEVLDREWKNNIK